MDIVILVLAADHPVKTTNEVLWWSFVAIISHLGLAPFVSIGVTQSDKWRSWKFDISWLVLLGAIRGVYINICVEQFDLVMNVHPLYKIFNSAIAIPQWFIAVAIFNESRRNYQIAFRELFAEAMNKEFKSKERKRILPDAASQSDETIARLQFITSNLAAEIQGLMSRPIELKDYSAQAGKIKSLIDNDIRPASAKLWRENPIKSPKISFVDLVRIVLLESRLNVLLCLLISAPYLFVGLNGAFGLRVALFQTLFVCLLDLIFFLGCEALFKYKIFKRSQANLFMLGSSFLIPLYLQLNVLPIQYRISSDKETVLFYQLLLSVTYVALLISINGYVVIHKQRAEVIISLERLVTGEKYLDSVVDSGEMHRNQDLANYLHGEIQAGLTASSLLLQQAAKSGDSELAHEALERASGLLNQDLSNISYTRMASPELKISKIIQGWKGIAEISVVLPSQEDLNENVMRNSVQLIEEAIANSIRHARATDIKVSGVLKEDLLTITIISNGDPMSKGKAGLGTQMFNDLSDEWSYATESGHNRLTFTLVNHL